MSDTDVVHPYPGGPLQRGARHITGLGQEVVLPINGQAHDFTLGDADADRLQRLEQPLYNKIFT